MDYWSMSSKEQVWTDTEHFLNVGTYIAKDICEIWWLMLLPWNSVSSAKNCCPFCQWIHLYMLHRDETRLKNKKSILNLNRGEQLISQTILNAFRFAESFRENLGHRFYQPLQGNLLRFPVYPLFPAFLGILLRSPVYPVSQLS